ncbi:ion channel [Phenylobacterium deserti]|uniref:ion channel n=1 Tax=Phenylobacterium deserti TaxID=1914756 RepID=UPI001F0C65A6|nr:ion channel [Phenylobacterium deserti]
MERPKGLRGKLRALYYGETRSAVRFRLSVISIDLLLIVFFIVTPLIRDDPRFLTADYIIACIVALDILARGYASPHFGRWLRQNGLLDLVVLITLLFPLSLSNFAFLRILRLWSLFHSDFFWDTVARRWDNTRWEDLTKVIATLVTYLFIVTGVVYALYARKVDDIDTYVDALYFTVTTVTTTGFGDITLPGATGKLISIAIMITGITLFVRLAQTVMRPNKVRFTCPTCGLMRHDPDAVYCKACATLLNIPNDED